MGVSVHYFTVGEHLGDMGLKGCVAVAEKANQTKEVCLRQWADHPTVTTSTYVNMLWVTGIL